MLTFLDASQHMYDAKRALKQVCAMNVINARQYATNAQETKHQITQR